MKQKFLLLMLLLLSCWGGTRADELTVYDETVTSYRVPVHGYDAEDYLKCEFVIPATELTEMKGGSLESMTFYLSSKASAAWTGTFQVFLKEVDFTTISAYQGTSNATIVYEGTLDATKASMKIDFSTPYTYGGRNLLVGVYHTIKGNYDSAYFYGTTVTGACVQGNSSSSLDYVGANQRNFIPKTTFEYETSSPYKAPKNVTQSNLTYSGVTYSWMAPEGATGYVYQYKKASEAEWSAQASASGTSVDLSGLTPETAYQFRVRASYSGGNSSEWATRSFTTLEKWKKPTNLQSSEVTHNSAKLSWTENGEATSWVVAYRESSETDFTEVEASENPFILEGLEENTQYYVKVRPKSDDGTIKWSSTTPTFTTKEKYPMPQSLSVSSIGTETATLKWSINSYNSSIRDGLEVRYKPTSGSGWTTVSVDKASTQYQLTGLQGGTQYEVQVYAKYGTVSSNSSETTFTTIAYNTVPTSLYTNDITYTGATLSWTGYQESYNVRWRTVSVLFRDGFEDGLDNWTKRDCYSSSGIKSNVFGALRYSHSGSKCFCFYGSSIYPNQILISPELTGISEGAKLTFWYQAEITDLKFKVGYSTTTKETDKFTWSDEQTAASTSYTKYEQTLPAGVKYIAICYNSTSWDFYVDDISIVDPANAYGKWQTANGVTSPYSLSDLTLNTTYEWQVQGIDTEHLSSGVTDWSDLTEFTTKNKWQTPTSLSLSNINHNSATLRWAENGLATSWIVAYKKSSDTDFTDLPATTEKPFTLTDLEPNTQYIVRVRPNSDDGNEWWSSNYSFTTNSFWTAPTLNSVSDYTHNSATLRWTENGGATSWVVAYKKSSDTDFTEVEASQNPFTLTGLDEQTQYTVKVSPKTDDATYKWSYTQTFTTKEQFPKPNYISAGNIGTEWATVRWSMPSSGSVIVGPVSGSTTTVVAATPAPSGDGSSKEVVVVGPSYGEAATPDGYVLSYRVKAGEGETEKEWTVIKGITKTSYELTDLTGGTQYEVCVQAKYGENLSGYHPSTTPYSFTTLSYCTVPSNLMATDIMRDAASLSWTGYQDSYDVQWREVPILFMDGFEDGLGNWTLRDCYSSQNGKTGINSTKSRYNHTGKQSFYFCGDPNHVLMDQKLISPELNDIPEGAKLSFWYCGSGQFWVGYSTATNSSEDFEWDQRPNENTEMIFEVNWGKYEFTLPADVKYIAIKFVYYGECYIDDVLITGPESAFGEWQTAENQEVPCTITGLKPDTYYEWRVMGKSEHCSGTDWSESSYFTTLSAQTKFFVKDGNWNVDDNWDPVGVPEPTEDVYIAAKATIPDGYVADVQNLTVFESGSITLKDGGQLKTLSSNVPVSFEKDITGYGEGDGTNYFIASPVNTLVKDIENLKTGDYDFYFFANFNPLEWLNMKNLAAYYPPEWDPDETFTIAPKEGYLYANKEDKTLTFSGSTGVPSKEYFCQSSIYSAPSSRFDGWYLVGNPYTCDAYVTLEPIMSSGSYIFVPATPADPSVVDFGEYGAPLGDIYVDLDDPGSPVVIDNPTAGGPFVTFYKMNATGDALKMYYDQVKLAPGEGVLVHAVIPPASGSGNVNYGITFFTENVFGDALSYEPEGDILIPILPRHGLAIDQDANGIMVMNNEKNSDILKKYDKSKVGDELLDVTLQGRTLFTDGRWNTLCLPFDLTAEQLTNSQLAGFQIKELDTEAGTYDHITGYEADTKTLWLNFKDVTEIEAGKPYIAKNTIFPLEGSGIELKDIENPKFTNVQIDSSDPEGIKSTDETTTFQGVYDPVVITEKDRSVLFLQGEKLYYPDGVKPTTIGACRAYFPLNGIYGGVPEETSGVHNFVLNFGDGETTGIATTKLTNQNVDWYSIDGRKLNQKPQQRGIYISNGRKVMVK